MPLDASTLNAQFSSTASATDNLAGSCRGILQTQVAPSGSPWYPPLRAELDQAHALADEWLARYAARLRDEVLTCVAHCGQRFVEARGRVSLLFNQAETDFAGARSAIQVELEALQTRTREVSGTVAAYQAGVRDWGRRLEAVNQQMSGTVGQIQARESALRSRVDATNATVAQMEAEVVRDRQAIADAESERTKGVVETVFGVILIPFIGGVSSILAGIGVSSIAEAQGKVAALEDTITRYQARIVGLQQNLTEDQAQLVALQALTVPARIALSDIQVAGQMLDPVEVSWAAFSQELDGVVAKVANARNASMLRVEEAWFLSAVRQWELVVSGVEGIAEVTPTARNVSCAVCDVPVVRIVNTAAHPPVPAGLKVDPPPGPDVLGVSPTCPVLTWGQYTYWAMDFVDNRVAMCLLGYDARDQLVSRTEHAGARYPWKMEYDPAAEVLTCYGQSNRAIRIPIRELHLSQQLVRVPAT